MEGGNHPTGRRPTADWQTVDRLFNAALDLPESERTAFLTLQCGDDSALGSAVERLLDAERRSATMFAAIGEERDALMREALDEPASGGAAAARIGEHLGPWRLTALLGEGGMAWVYLAERADGRWEQHVAVKLLRAAARRE